MVLEKFQIFDVKITGKYICESKNWICSFLIVQNSPPGSYYYPQAERNYPPLQNSLFWRSLFFPSRKGGWERGWRENYGAEKMTKIKLLRVLVTNFDKFHHLCNFFIFGYCLFVPQFQFKHTRVKCSLN